MRKRCLVAGLLALLLAVALMTIACGGSKEAATTVTSTGSSSDSATASSTDTTAASSSTTAAATGEPIKIGHLVNLTCPEAMVGEKMAKSLQYAFDVIGNQIAGRPVQIIVGDAGGEASVAVDTAKKMVEVDKVVAVIGPTEIGQKMAVANYCKQVGIPNIVYGPSPTVLFNNNKWAIGSGGTVMQCPTCMAAYMYNELGYRSIITLAPDDSAGRSMMDPLTAVFTKLGGKVVQQEWVPEENTDFSSYLSALKDADALVAWKTGSNAIGLLSQWHQLGIDKKMPIVAAYSGGFTDPFVPAAMAPADAAAVVGTLAPIPYSPDSTDPIIQKFVQGFQSAIGYPPGDDGCAGPYQVGVLIQAALTATGGDTTPDKLLSAIYAAKITGPEGPESFAPGEQAATKTIYIVKVDKVPNVDKTFRYVTVHAYENVPPSGYSGQ